MLKKINKTRHNDLAFTLIEISVVLVIIGLIVGGVLVGRDLVEAARIRSQLAQFEEFKTGHNTFKLKYNCIAADCNNIANFLNGAANGNGNGVIENANSDPDSVNAINMEFTGEQTRYFAQLSQAGVISGNYDSTNAIDRGYPSTKLNPSAAFAVARDRLTVGDGPCSAYAQGLIYSFDCMGYRQFNVTLFAALGYLAHPNYRSKSTNYGIFTASQTSKMDSKIDDGLPFTGSLRAGNPGNAAVSNGNCTTNNTSSGIYNFSNNVNACHTALKLE